MSFKILNEEEKQFLNEEELRKYNEEYESYIERNKFVDWIESVGKANIGEYKPVLKKLAPTAAVKEIIYENPKNEKINITDRINTGDISFPGIPDKFELPEYSVFKNNISIVHTENIVKEIPKDYPVDGIPEIKAYKISNVDFNMPDTVLSEIKTDFVSEVRAFNFEVPDWSMKVTENIKRDYKVQVQKYTVPETEKPVLDTKIPSLRESVKFEMPELGMSDCVQPAVCSVKPENKFSLPEFKVDMPELKPAKEVKVKAFTAEKVSVSNMPVLDIKSVSVPEKFNFKADMDPVPDISEDQFRIPEIPKIPDFNTAAPSEISIPDINVCSFVSKKFEMPELEKVTLNINVPSVSDIKLK